MTRNRGLRPAPAHNERIPGHEPSPPHPVARGRACPPGRTRDGCRRRTGAHGQRHPRQEIDVAGSGFPPDADVQLVILRNGTDAGSQALHTDADGAFSATIDAGPGRGGVYTMTATAGAVSATVKALAVETAGGLQTAPPPTDTTPGTGGCGPDASGRLAILALIAAGSTSLALSILRRRVPLEASSSPFD